MVMYKKCWRCVEVGESCGSLVSEGYEDSAVECVTEL